VLNAIQGNLYMGRKTHPSGGFCVYKNKFMGIFSTKIQRLEKKGAYLLGLLKDELRKRSKNLDRDVVGNAVFIKGKMERVVYKYGYLKTKYQYENDLEVLSEIAEDYHRFLATAVNMVVVSHNEEDFRFWQRKFRLGMLEIENIEKKFDILLK